MAEFHSELPSWSKTGLPAVVTDPEVRLGFDKAGFVNPDIQRQTLEHLLTTTWGEKDRKVALMENCIKPGMEFGKFLLYINPCPEALITYIHSITRLSTHPPFRRLTSPSPFPPTTFCFTSLPSPPFRLFRLPYSISTPLLSFPFHLYFLTSFSTSSPFLSQSFSASPLRFTSPRTSWLGCFLSKRRPKLLLRQSPAFIARLGIPPCVKEPPSGAKSEDS